MALILINYISGLAIEHFDQRPALRKAFLLAALIGSLGMLFYFKYANFVLRSANTLLGTGFAEIQGIGTLPLGISFYTFQTLSLIHISEDVANQLAAYQQDQVAFYGNYAEFAQAQDNVENAVIAFKAVSYTHLSHLFSLSMLILPFRKGYVHRSPVPLNCSYCNRQL